MLMASALNWGGNVTEKKIAMTVRMRKIAVSFFYLLKAVAI